MKRGYQQRKSSTIAERLLDKSVGLIGVALIGGGILHQVHTKASAALAQETTPAAAVSRTPFAIIAKTLSEAGE